MIFFQHHNYQHPHHRKGYLNFVSSGILTISFTVATNLCNNAVCSGLPRRLWNKITVLIKLYLHGTRMERFEERWIERWTKGKLKSIVGLVASQFLEARRSHFLPPLQIVFHKRTHRLLDENVVGRFGKWVDSFFVAVSSSWCLWWWPEEDEASNWKKKRSSTKPPQ